jgi:hypothetical protein
MAELKKSYDGVAYFPIFRAIVESKPPEIEDKYLNMLLQK